jgi:hypothetical protein
MKALLIRVGFDCNWGGIKGPIFDDGCFKFIPVPEKKKECKRIKNPKRYSDIPALSEYLPNDFLKSNGDNIPIEDCIVHDDPEFDTFTYGDHTSKGRGGAVKKLRPGDYIIFLAGLVPYKKDTYANKTLNAIDRKQRAIGELKICIVGYFRVTWAQEYSKMTEQEKRQIKNNTHLKRDPPDKKLIIVKGDGKNNSKLLKKAFCISEPGKMKDGRRYYVTSPKFNKMTGLTKKQISRGCRWIEGNEKVKKLINVLNRTSL